MTSLFFDIARISLSWLLVIYTVVAITHYAVQLIFAHRTYTKQRSAVFKVAHPGVAAAVDIVVPVYNEEPALLEACLRSALVQDHPGPIQVVVVDDGSPNRAALDAIYDRFEDLGVRVIRSPRNVGKRQAQALALPLCTGEIIVTLDSDSVLSADAVRLLTRQFDDPAVGAATGFVDVANRSANLLTRIQRIRYWMAFNQERAAQTWFRTVMCCSGPLAAYRRSILETVKGAYLSQTYGGVACTYGDDRHLTNLVLGQGHDVVYDSAAIAFTNVPTSLRGFLRQQLRWNKSFYRELIWTLPYIGSRSLFSKFDVVCQVAMPVMLTVTAGSALFIGVLTNPAYILRYLALIAVAAMVRSTYAVLRERDPRFYLFLLYGYVSAFLLMSVRFRALSTLTDARWGTRGPQSVSRAGAAMATVVAGLQPMRSAAEGATGWARLPDPHDWAGGNARSDSPWRTGLRSRMMAHPIESPADLPPAVGGQARRSASAGTSGRAGTDLVGGKRRTPRGLLFPIPIRRPRTHDGVPVAAVPTPTTIRSGTLHAIQPLGTYAPGPTCRHAIAFISDAPFCKACGAGRGVVFSPHPAPVEHLRARMEAQAVVLAARELRAAARAAEMIAGQMTAVASPTAAPATSIEPTDEAVVASAPEPVTPRRRPAAAKSAEAKHTGAKAARPKTAGSVATVAKATRANASGEGDRAAPTSHDDSATAPPTKPPRPRSRRSPKSGGS